MKHLKPTVLIILWLACGLAWQAGLAPSTLAGVASLSAGVSERGRAAHPEYSLKLVFALASGAYLSNVQVEILDQDGRSVLKAATRGPWLFAKLSPGTYRVVARRGRGPATEAVITIEGSRQKRVYLTWP